MVEGHLMPDHVHMMIAIPPKYAVPQVIGLIEGKSATHLARVYGERKRNFVGQHFWAGGRAAGPTRPVEMSRHGTGGSRNAGPRRRPRTAALSGSLSNASGSAGGLFRMQQADIAQGVVSMEFKPIDSPAAAGGDGAAAGHPGGSQRNPHRAMRGDAAEIGQRIEAMHD